MDKFDADKQCLMCREGLLSHDLLQATTGQFILIVWHHYEISIYLVSSRYRRPIYSENMSEIEYYDLIFEISTKIDVNQLERLVFMCTKKISEGSEGTIKSARGLFKELEKQGYLGIDRLENLKEILKQLKKRSMIKKVEEFEIKRRGT